MNNEFGTDSGDSEDFTTLFVDGPSGSRDLHPASRGYGTADQSAAATIPFRSLMRAPTALLTAFDDGSMTQGETWRLRQACTTIGRADGDVTIPNDPDLSACHAKIVRTEAHGTYQWKLIDRESTNGTFVRVSRLVMRTGRELMLGSRRFMFTAQQSPSDAQRPEADSGTATHHQTAISSEQWRQLRPRLTDLATAGNQRHYEICGSGTLIGRDQRRCRICPEDPFLDVVHAELFQDQQYRWVIRDRASLNGVWARVPSAVLDSGTEFILGGQRFRFDLL